MKLKKYALLVLITLSLTIPESWGVNFKLTLLNSTAVAQTVNDREAEADRLIKQGNKQFDISQFQQALQSWQQSLAIYREIEDRQGIAISLNNLGNAYDSLGDHGKTIDYRQQSLSILKEIGDQKLIAISLNNMGNSYIKLGDYRKAIRYLRDSLKIQKEIGDREGIAMSQGNLGLAYRYLRNNRKAIYYHQQSLEIFKQIGNRLHQAISLVSLGCAYGSVGDYRKAIDHYQQSLKIAKQIGYREGIAKSAMGLGLAYRYLGDYRKAIDYHLQYLEISKGIGDRQSIATSLANLGILYKKLKKYEDAEKYFREAITTWEDIRKLLRNQDANKITIFDTHALAYRLLQEVLVAQNQPLKALEISERGRNRALVEILWRQLSQKPEQELIPPSPNLTKIKQIAQQQNATLVEYSLTPSEIYIWVIPPQGKIQFRNVNLPKDVSLTELVKFSRDSIGARGRNSNNPQTQRENPTNRLKQLHQLLIKPIAEFLPKDEQQRVIFIPHQELFSVPFVALQDEKNKYLIEKHTILTAPSIQALDLTQQNKQVQKNSSVRVLPGNQSLIVGNPTMPKDKVGKDLKPLEQLPGAEDEAKNIAEMLKTKPIIGNEATESAIVEKMASAKLIHLATHGLLDDINAIGSAGAIAFTPDSKNDGFLTTSEIMERFGLPGKQKLKADLVVLSACDTGRGDIRAEGIIGLSRAFMASGVPSLVVSLWKVPDDATTSLMTEFYTNIYKRKLDKATAMRKAMLTMIENDPDPINWAAFTVIGKAE